MKGETIRSSKKREYFILSIPCNLTKWMDPDDRGNDELDRGTRSRHLYEMLLRSNSCCISQLFDTFTVISRQSSLILSGGTHGLLVNNSKMATTRCIFTGRLFGIYSEGGATVSRIYIHTLGKGLAVAVPRDIFGRSCSKIEGRRDRKLHPMADQGTPMVASPGAICQRRIRNLNSDIYIYTSTNVFSPVCMCSSSFLSTLCPFLFLVTASSVFFFFFLISA